MMPVCVRLDEIDLVGLVIDREVAVEHPRPPWRAIAIAIRDSVTVSIAADTKATFSEIHQSGERWCQSRTQLMSVLREQQNVRRR